MNYNEIYLPIMSRFLSSISNIDCTGIPYIFTPHFREGYENSEIRFAFIGIDTKGNQIETGDLEIFKSKSQNNCPYGLYYWVEEYDNGEFIDYVKGNNYYGFIFSFLSSFYGYTNYKEVINEIKNGNTEIFDSFIYANTNALEAYQITAKKLGVNFQTYESVKNASEQFDKLKLIYDAFSPDHIIITNWNINDAFFQMDDLELAWINYSDHVRYCSYNKTKIIQTVHPRSMSQFKGKNRIIKDLIDIIKKDG